MPKKQQEYGNETIRQLKGADRVRKRPAVIFGSDGVEGCAHSIFEIVSNSIDEARDGHGNRINVTLFPEHVVEVEDFGRGIPVDYNKVEERWNWELIFCELYAGGKYGEGSGNYDFSLGLNGLGLCATQYASEWMTADVYRDGFHYHLDFKKGENVGGLQKEPFSGRRTGSVIRWKPDTEVFTDINVPAAQFQDMLRRQAVVNDGVTMVFNDKSGLEPQKYEYLYEHGITDYANEIVGDKGLTPVHFCSGAATGRDRADQPDYQVKMNVAFAFSNTVQTLEYYHNSSWLEHGGSPDRAVRTAFVNQINAWLKAKNLYKKNESAITFNDVQDCLVLVSSSFSTRTSYENQTKKAITNKFVAQAMTEFLKHQIEVYFIEHPDEAEKACKQVLINKQSREHAEKARITIKKTMTQQMDLANRVQKFVDCRTKDAARRELYIVEGDSAMGAVKQSRDSEFQAIMPIRGKILNCLKADYARIFKSEIITDLIRVMGCGVELGGNYAKGLAYAAEKPLVPVHHLRGHIAANYLTHPELKPPFLCLVASGGHSHIVMVEDWCRYKILGRTVDDAAGEAYDKVARTLGLPYPGGPSVAAAARGGDPKAYKLPVPHVEGKYNVSFSGLKTAVINEVHNAEQKGNTVNVADMAASFQERIDQILAKKLLTAAADTGAKTICLAGGVAANGRLRQLVNDGAQKLGCRVFLPELKYCGDNGAMIAAQGYYEYQDGNLADWTLNGLPTLPIDYR